MCTAVSTGVGSSVHSDIGWEWVGHGASERLHKCRYKCVIGLLCHAELICCSREENVQTYSMTRNTRCSDEMPSSGNSRVNLCISAITTIPSGLAPSMLLFAQISGIHAYS